MKKMFFLLCLGIFINTASYAKSIKVNISACKMVVLGEYLCQKMTNFNTKGQVTDITYVYCDANNGKKVRTKTVQL